MDNMKKSNVIIGIDVGGSTTKIVGFHPSETYDAAAEPHTYAAFTRDWRLIEPLAVRAADPLTSLYGAFGKFTDRNGVALSDIGQIMVTGVGSTYLDKPLYGVKCTHVPEFRCIGLGGLYLSGLPEAIVVSMGTGTALVYAADGRDTVYLGGTGVGGGTLIGLSKMLLGMDNVNHIVELAAKGDLNKVDLRIKDITNKDILPGLPDVMTAANFGKLSDLADKPDIALGIINMVFETIGMMAIFSARSHNTRDIVLTGNLTNVPQAASIFSNLNSMFNVNFQIPVNSQYGTVIGSALCGFGM